MLRVAILYLFTNAAIATAIARSWCTAGSRPSVPQSATCVCGNPSQIIQTWDASTLMSKGLNNEGENHGKLDLPTGSVLNSIKVCESGSEEIAAFWTENPHNEEITHAFIVIHGKQRDGFDYWTTMNGSIADAIRDNFPGVPSKVVVVAPQFFSTNYNSGQYTENQLAWGDVNAWQAGVAATHPPGTRLSSIDALDALVGEFADQIKYPKITNVTVVGHGGGGQLTQRYAAVGAEPPSHIHVRYIHGDPSSNAYFTTDRPTVSGQELPSKISCEWYNTWRYGFANFTGTSDGLKSPQDYFRQYITRDVVSIVGYKDVTNTGDEYCMAIIQGGHKRRDRNLIWYRYVNTLARTRESLDGFPGSFDALPDWSNTSNNTISLRLTVAKNATHNPDKLFKSKEGRSVLFSHYNVDEGWRPNRSNNT
ncbi:hypothetical protein PT974_00044 [Cladobotryum mycophilum]|uniref:Transmembrane protein n=1 Tax=Cladobotryum mycophilum TaxID=491253 RepID=A0ABR0SZY8_9HYPO